jgi:hypothetical protein
MVQPVAIRRRWCYVDYESFVRGTAASTLPPLEFEDWVPAAVRDEARKIQAETSSQKDPVKAASLLSRLTSNTRMKAVWAEFNKRKRDNYKSTDQYVNRMYMTNASRAPRLRKEASWIRDHGPNKHKIDSFFMDLEAEQLERSSYDPLLHTPWTEQELGMQFFLWKVHDAALDIKLYLKRDVPVLRRAAEQLRELAAKLQPLHVDCRALGEVAVSCDNAARMRDVDPTDENPTVMVREASDPKLRTYVVELSGVTTWLCGKNMRGTIANVANVALDREDITDRDVGGILRAFKSRSASADDC